MSFSIFIILCLISGKISEFKSTDFKDKSTFLVFLTFEKSNFKCPSCEYFRKSLDNVNIPVKNLNFNDNIRLGSRFMRVTFPSFIIRSNLKSYVLEPKSIEEMLDIINSGKWKTFDPVKSYIDVNSLLVKIFSQINPMILIVIDWLYIIMDRIGDKFVYYLLLFIIIYLIYSIIELFFISEKTTKVD